jgi:hypothetical protein
MNRLEDERASELADLPRCNSSVSCSVAPSRCHVDLLSAVGDKEGQAVRWTGSHRQPHRGRQTDGSTQQEEEQEKGATTSASWLASA